MVLMARKGAVEAFLHTLRKLPKKLVTDVLEGLADESSILIAKSLGASKSAGNRPLRVTKSGRPAKLFGQYSIKVIGDIVKIAMPNPLAYHQTGAWKKGTAWRLPRRAVIPYRQLTAHWAKALQNKAEKVLSREKL